MALTLKGRVVDRLDHEKVLADLESGLSYDEVGELHGCSKGSVWRIASHHNRLKTKKHGMSSNVKRSGWACGRPMAKYKGAYPGGFLRRLDEKMRITEDMAVLHLFSGSIQGRENEHTMDIQASNNPTFVADARERFPMEDGTYDVVIADPPYDMETTDGRTIDYSSKLWKTEFIKPYSWVDEAVRVTKVGGYICVLHNLVYITPPFCRRAEVVSITCGPNTRIRNLGIFQKMEEWIPKDERKRIKEQEEAISRLLQNLGA